MEEGTKGGDTAEKEKKRDKRKAFVFSSPLLLYTSTYCTFIPLMDSFK